MSHATGGGSLVAACSPAIVRRRSSAGPGCRGRVAGAAAAAFTLADLTAGTRSHRRRQCRRLRADAAERASGPRVGGGRVAAASARTGHGRGHSVTACRPSPWAPRRQAISCCTLDGLGWTVIANDFLRAPVAAPPPADFPAKARRSPAAGRRRRRHRLRWQGGRWRRRRWQAAGGQAPLTAVAVRRGPAAPADPSTPKAAWALVVAHAEPKPRRSSGAPTALAVADVGRARKSSLHGRAPAVPVRVDRWPLGQAAAARRACADFTAPIRRPGQSADLSRPRRQQHRRGRVVLLHISLTRAGQSADAAHWPGSDTVVPARTHRRRGGPCVWSRRPAGCSI